MELRHLVKIFEEKKFKTWMCPLINSHCDHDCYCYASKSFSLLLEFQGSSYPQTWGQRFFKSEEIMVWGRSLERKVTVVNYMIYPPNCSLLDALKSIGGFDA